MRERSRSCRTSSSPRTSSAAPRSCAAATDYGVPLARRLDEALARAPAGARRRPLGRAGARPAWSASASPAACSRRSSRTSAPTSASTRRSSSRSRCPRSGSSAPASGSARPPSPAHAARLLARDRKVVVVAMGRGGPPEPEVARCAPTSTSCSSSRAPAATPRPTTSRPRRSPASRRSAAAAAAAGSPGAVSSLERPRGSPARGRSSDPDLVIFDGSGAALPPVETSRRSSSSDAHQDPDVVTGYLNAYRLLVSDLVVLTMAEEGSRHGELRRAGALDAGAEVVATTLRPAAGRADRRPAGRVLLHGAEPAHDGFARAPREEHGADVVHVSGSLADRAAARGARAASRPTSSSSRSRPRRSTSSPRRPRERGVEVVFADNDVLAARRRATSTPSCSALAEAAAA